MNLCSSFVFFSTAISLVSSVVLKCKKVQFLSPYQCLKDSWRRHWIQLSYRSLAGIAVDVRRSKSNSFIEKLTQIREHPQIFFKFNSSMLLFILGGGSSLWEEVYIRINTTQKGIENIKKITKKLKQDGKQDLNKDNHYPKKEPLGS